MEHGKRENLEIIKKHSNSEKKMMIMIGDGKDDLKAAKDFNIKFYPVGNKLTKKTSDFTAFI